MFFSVPFSDFQLVVHTQQFQERATVVKWCWCCSWGNQCCFRCSLLFGLLLFVQASCSHTDLGSAGVSLFSAPTNLMVICLSSFHPTFPLRRLCSGAIQQESVATQLSTSPSLFQRRLDLCWSRWESAVLLFSAVVWFLILCFYSNFLKWSTRPVQRCSVV